MVKIKKSSPNSKRKGVKNESMPYSAVFQSDIVLSLTAMLYERGSRSNVIFFLCNVFKNNLTERDMK
jgi:hypothetical protein